MTTATDAAAGDASDALRDELRDLLVQATEGKFSADEIDPSANFFDYGYVDSLSAVMFLAQIEESYGIRIDDVDLVERYNTLEAIADCIRQGA